MVIIQILKPCNWNPGRIIKPDKDFVKNQDFKNIKFSVKVSDIHKIEKKKKKKKKNSIWISVLGYENKEKHQIYVSQKFCEEKHVDLVLIEEKGKKHYVLIKDFNTFMHYYTLHCKKK